MSPNSAHARMAYQPGVGSDVRIPVMLAGMRMAHVPRLVAKGTCDEAQSEEDTVRRLSRPQAPPRVACAGTDCDGPGATLLPRVACWMMTYQTTCLHAL